MSSETKVFDQASQQNAQGCFPFMDETKNCVKSELLCDALPPSRNTSQTLPLLPFNNERNKFINAKCWKHYRLCRLHVSIWASRIQVFRNEGMWLHAVATVTVCLIKSDLPQVGYAPEKIRVKASGRLLLSAGPSHSLQLYWTRELWRELCHSRW